MRTPEEDARHGITRLPAPPGVERDRLPCGCIIETAVEDGEKQLRIRPCSETCTFYAYVITESRKRGNRYERRLDPGLDA